MSGRLPFQKISSGYSGTKHISRGVGGRRHPQILLLPHCIIQAARLNLRKSRCRKRRLPQIGQVGRPFAIAVWRWTSFARAIARLTRRPRSGASIASCRRVSQPLRRRRPIWIAMTAATIAAIGPANSVNSYSHRTPSACAAAATCSGFSPAEAAKATSKASSSPRNA